MILYIFENISWGSSAETENAKTFKIADFEAQELSRQKIWNFLGCLTTFLSVHKLSRVSKNSKSFLETFQSVQQLSTVSIKISEVAESFPPCLETFQSVEKFSWVPVNFQKTVICRHIFDIPTQKLSRLQKHSIKQCFFWLWSCVSTGVTNCHITRYWERMVGNELKT